MIVQSRAATINTSRWHGTLNNQRLNSSMRFPQTLLILCLSILHPNSGTLISEWNPPPKKTWTTEQQSTLKQVLVRCIWCFPLFQEWHDFRNLTVVALILKRSTCGGCWCSDSSLGPLVVKPFLSGLDSLVKALVISLGSALFPAGSSFHWYAVIQHWTASLFCNDLVWCYVLVEGVDYHLDDCQA